MAQSWLLSLDLLSVLSGPHVLLFLSIPRFSPPSCLLSWAADEWFSRGKLLLLHHCTLLQLPVAIVDVLTCTLFCRRGDRSRDKHTAFILVLACFSQATSHLQKRLSLASEVLFEMFQVGKTMTVLQIQ